MKKKLSGESRLRIFSCLFVLSLLAAFIVLPSQFRSEAVSDSENSDLQMPNRFEDFDIRNQSDVKNTEIEETLEQFRQSSNTDAVTRADIRDGFVQGEKLLKRKIPTLKVEYSRQLHNPEVIEPDVFQGGVLERTSNQSRAEILRNFAIQNDNLIGLERGQIVELKVTADYKNPQGSISFARLEQFINGIPVFRGEIRAGFSYKGEMFRVVNNLASGLDYNSLSTDFGDPATAIKRASGYLNHELKVTTLNKAKTNDLKAVFGDGDWATTAEKMYFPIETGVARAAWRVLIWELGDAYYVIVDAETGKLLNRECITAEQTEAATYNVYANADSLLRVMANPAPVNPGPLDPGLGIQGNLMPRSNVTTIGNEAAYSFNNNGWMNDGAFGGNGETDGNNVEAGVDRDNTNGVDATVKGANRIFNFSYTPGAGADNTAGDSPLSAAYQNGAATHLFYTTNRFHDETYLLGFTEQARNFQQDNFGRGGSGNDRVSAEAQDDTIGSSCPSRPCVNNANFSTPADGSRGRMQMYLWSLMTPNRDGDLDAEVIVHELTHGLFARLHNGGGGTQYGQMNEGNSDFFAHVMLAKNDDPIKGIFVTGGYVTLNLRSVFGGTGNYYYGIRRFPKAVMSFTGGANNRPHNPLTFADIDPAQIDTSDGAFPEAFSGSATSSHNGGEVWSSALWEVRAKIIQRIGAQAGNKKILQLVMDGMKLAPSAPTMLQERDAIISAALNNGNSGDIGDVWAGFAIRGMGFSAQNPSGNTVVEAFDLPNAQVAQTGFAVSDATGDNDGFPEPGENVVLTVPVTNVSGGTINNVSVTVNGGTSVSYGTIANAATVTTDIPFTIPANAVCGSLYRVQIGGSSDVGTLATVTREFRLGVPVGGAPQTFSNDATIALPATGTSGAASPYPSEIAVSGLSGTKIIKLELTEISHTYPNDLDFLLVAPGGQKYIFLSDSGGGTDVSNLTFTLSDGAAAQIGSSAWTNGDFRPYNDGANDPFDSPAPAQPYSNASTAGNDTFASVFGTDGAAMNGTWKLYAVDDLGSDFGLINGWKLTFEAADYACSLTSSGSKRADFDGDGKTDLSVFRPSDGNWYVNRSTAGFIAVNFGTLSDTLTPGDFDGDGKIDVAVFRPSNGSWYYLKSSDNSFVGVQFGQNGDIPMPGDFDGDGKTDINVFRPSNGAWYRTNSSDGSFVANVFGQNGDKPQAGDFDGDGKADLAVFRPSDGFWYIARPTGVSAQNFDAVRFGLDSDIQTPADYDGDGKTDIAVFRPSNGAWYRINSSNNQFNAVIFGQSGDIPVPGDYDGDGKYDEAVVRSGTWYLNQSTNGFAGSAFGFSTDKAIPKSYIP